MRKMPKKNKFTCLCEKKYKCEKNHHCNFEKPTCASFSLNHLRQLDLWMPQNRESFHQEEISTHFIAFIMSQPLGSLS